MLPASSAAHEYRAAIEYLLADPRYAAAAQALGERVADEVHNSPVVEALERLADRSGERRQAA
jgi:UDP:flavonoid glycosyltransferase YjiC (YdhE family)